MTVIVGAIFPKGFSVIAADDLATTQLNKLNDFSKLEVIGDSILGFAGTANYIIPLIRDIKDKLADLDGDNDSTHSNLLSKIQSHYKTRRTSEINDSILAGYLTSYQEYKSGNFNVPPELRGIIASKVEQFSLNLELIITGYDTKGLYMNSVSNPGVVTNIDFGRNGGWGCTGIGKHASNSYLADYYDPNMSVNEGLLTVFNAKKNAESVPGVGTGSEVYLVTQKGIKRLTKKAINDLDLLHQKRSEQIRGIDDIIQSDVGKLDFGVRKLM